MHPGPRFVHGYAPLLGGGRFQHASGRGAHPPHRHEEMAHAPRAIGILIAVPGLVTGGLDDPDARPIGAEFIGHHHRQAGADTLAHLGAVTDDGNLAAVRDRYEYQRLIHPAMGHGIGPVFHLGLVHFVGETRPGHARRQHEAGQGQPLEKVTATGIDHPDAFFRHVLILGMMRGLMLALVHDACLRSDATCRMAVRIRV